MRPFLGTDEAPSAGAPFQLSPEQVRYFETFGFLKLRNLFVSEIDDIAAGFDAIFEDEANERMETHYAIHGERRRVTIPSFIDKDRRLQWLRSDDRVLGIARSLIGPDYNYGESDGSIFYCGTAWHADIFGAPMSQYHVKLYFYLDVLSAESGAIRMIPGTNHFSETFATTLRADLEDPAKVLMTYGVDGSEIPSVALDTNPGDLLVGNYRTLHASFKGGDGRRLFTMSFKEPRSS